MIRVHRSLAAAEADWRAAEAALVHYGFQRFDWLASWWETLGATVQPLVVAVRDGDGAPRLLLPLGLRRWRGLRALVLPGAPVTDYRGPLVARDFDPDGFPALWEAIRAALPRFDVIRFERMPEAVEGVPNPLLRLPGARASERAWSAVLPGSFEAFRATRRASFFGDSRRKRRRLGEVGPVRFEVAAGPAAMEAVLAVMKTEKSRRWAETGNPDGFADPAMAAFYDRVTRRMPEAVHGSLLRAGETPVAAHWGIVHAGRFYYLMIGSAAGEWARFSPGRLLVEDLVVQAIADGLRIFDLTVGDEGYKKDWADTVMPLWDVRQGVSAAGRAAVAAEAALAAARERARRLGWLRRLVRRARGRPGGEGERGTRASGEE